MLRRTLQVMLLLSTKFKVEYKNVPLTKPIIKHSGHKTPAAPVAPPELSASGSIEVNILGIRQTNNDTNTTIAQRNFRSDGTLRRMKYLRKQKSSGFYFYTVHVLVNRPDELF